VAAFCFARLQLFELTRVFARFDYVAKKGNLSYLAIIQAVRDSRGGVSDRCGRRFAKQKRVTDENNSFVT
jgi:hypothetical protein